MLATKLVHVKDLPDQIGTAGPRALLLCAVCGEENSAHRGDYFLASPETVLRHCGEPMRLATKGTVYRDA